MKSKFRRFEVIKNFLNDLIVATFLVMVLSDGGHVFRWLWQWRLKIALWLLKMGHSKRKCSIVSGKLEQAHVSSSTPILCKKRPWSFAVELFQRLLCAFISRQRVLTIEVIHFHKRIENVEWTRYNWPTIDGVARERPSSIFNFNASYFVWGMIH